MGHWSKQILLGFSQLLLHLVGQYLFNANCVFRELCLPLGERGRKSCVIDVSLVGIEEEGVGMMQTKHIHKHLKHL